jgi:hypothetical protein
MNVPARMSDDGRVGKALRNAFARTADHKSEEQVELDTSEIRALRTQIEYRSPPDGKLYVEKMQLIEEDRRRAELLLRSGNEQDQRLARIRLDGLTDIEEKWKADLAMYKARLKALRG